jgi:hypothetical protein
MRRSEQPSLTTQTGNLPRPAALAQLYARRACGESVNPSALAKLVVANRIDVAPKSP